MHILLDVWYLKSFVTMLCRLYGAWIIELWTSFWTFICLSPICVNCSNVFLTVVIYDQIEKNVFVVFYSGEKVKMKILKICEAFGANRYPFNDDIGKQAQMISEVREMLLLLYFIVIWMTSFQFSFFTSFTAQLIACFFLMLCLLWGQFQLFFFSTSQTSSFSQF